MAIKITKKPQPDSQEGGAKASEELTKALHSIAEVPVGGPKVKKTKKEVTGEVLITKKSGAQTEEQIPVAVVEVEEAKPMANVGFSVAMTKNLGNYESVKVQVSLHLPCANSEEAINEGYTFAQLWVDDKMQKVLEEL